MTSRRRWVPASGAKVRLDLRTELIFSTSSSEKLSTRKEGNDKLTWSRSDQESSFSSSGSMVERSLVESEVSDTSS